MPDVGYEVYRVPAEFAKAEADRRARAVWVGFAVYVVVDLAWLAFAVTGAVSGWTTLLIPLGALAVKPTADTYVDRQLNWARGAAAERTVGETLNELRYEGWIVMHDLARPGEGNVDHLVSGPGGVFMVETKWRRYEDRDLGKAKWRAKQLHDDLGVWVTPVIAIAERAKPDAFKAKGVWIVPRQSLLSWLREQHNTTLEFERLARFADRV